MSKIACADRVARAPSRFRTRCFAILYSFVVLALYSGAEPASARIKIGIIGDQTFAPNLDNAYGTLQQGVDELKQEHLDVVLHAGDLIESTASLEEITERFNQAVKILNELPAPWYMTAGDHDVSPPRFVPNSPDHSREALFQKLYGDVNPLVRTHLYYSFDVKKYHFIVLYSFEALDVDPRWGNVFYSDISDMQYEWLAHDLATHAGNSRGIVVLLHQPMWYVWSNWSRIHRLLAQYQTKAVIAGHFHYNQIDSRIDNIEYRVVGATGAETKHGSPNAGDLQHVSVLTIEDNGKLDFRMVPLSPYAQTTWTSRRVMDRVEAIDSLLGNVSELASNSPVYLENGTLVAQCGTNNPAKLSLLQLGNADASPVEVKIDVEAPNMTVAGVFGDGMCESEVQPLSCKLSPSAGVAISNTSIVEQSTYAPPPALWTATITAANPSPTAGTTITVAVHMSLTTENQTFTVGQSATTTVQACAK
jgi:3',5'-cyclic AMP phosphodiesterase CpdA